MNVVINHSLFYRSFIDLCVIHDFILFFEKKKKISTMNTFSADFRLHTKIYKQWHGIKWVFKYDTVFQANDSICLHSIIKLNIYSRRPCQINRDANCSHLLIGIYYRPLIMSYLSIHWNYIKTHTQNHLEIEAAIRLEYL